MKKFKALFSLIVVLAAIMLINSAKCYASEIQYSENLIPVMTSYNSPSGIVTASDSYSGCPGWKAFDKNINHNQGSYYSWAISGTNGWLAYEFPSSQIVTKYTIQTNVYTNSISTFPRDWTFEAWDGTTWVVMDKQTNITDWKNGIKKEFVFANDTPYKKYRINITCNVANGSVGQVDTIIGELEMMGPATTQVSAPTNLTATASDTKIGLKWDAVEGATSYNIKRSETAAGPYTLITPITSVSGSSIICTDNTAQNNKTYYYVVSAILSGTESPNSNEASAALKEPEKKMKLVFEVNEEHQLSVTDDLTDNAKMTWTSSDPTVATVDTDGKVKALKSGNTVITCTSQDGSYNEVINVLVVDLDLQLAVDLNIGQTCRLTADDLADNSNVTWISDNPAIATVSNKGKVTAVSEGLTFITAKDDQGNEIGKIFIRVRI